MFLFINSYFFQVFRSVACFGENVSFIQVHRQLRGSFVNVYSFIFVLVGFLFNHGKMFICKNVIFESPIE